MAKAETGTGKTLAFGAPMIAKIDPARHTVLGLVLSPTRELAQQVYEVLKTLGESRGLKANLIVGGEPMGPQVRTLQAGAQVVVGTPGRVLDLMDQGFLSFPWTEFVVLDEADKMLEIGFIDDIKKILRASNEYRQTLLFSATFPPALLDMAREYTNNPLEVATSSGVSTADTVAQYFMPVGGDDRTRELRDLIRASGEKDIFLVFCDRRTDVDKLMRNLERERFSVKALHGGYDQASRFRVMDAFRTGDVKVLVATDVASRGLDVNHVTHVVNLNAPRDVSDYTHRIGRTGRAGRTGTAVTFVGGIDQRKWKDIEDALPVDVSRINSPRELFDKSRPAKKERPERSRDGGRDRDDNSDSARGNRVRQSSREDRPERSERPSRGDSESSRVRSRGRAERPERKAEEERPRREREERPRREREERSRPEREERPRREREERSRPEREERPRREREERSRPEREERPRRERSSRPREDRDSQREERAPRDSGRDRKSEDSRSSRSRAPRDSEPRSERPAKAPLQESSSRSKSRPTSSQSKQRNNDDNSGFGAGI
ncbi:MAG: superfamily II DNA/RNA helicase [Glaciecola sp.]